MKVSLVAAIGQNRELGKNNELLWHLHEDMQFFKQITTGYYVVMGRKSFESIPPKYRPLPNRVNVIISRNPEYLYRECFTCGSISDAIDLAKESGETQIFIIGGGEIYRQAMESGIVDEMFLTHVQASFPDADVHFPAYDQYKWNKETIHSFQSDSRNEYAFDIVRYEKIPG